MSVEKIKLRCRKRYIKKKESIVNAIPHKVGTRSKKDNSKLSTFLEIDDSRAEPALVYERSPIQKFVFKGVQAFVNLF